MRLTTKLLAIFLAVTLITVAIEGVFTVDREIALYNRDMKQSAISIGRAARMLVREVWRVEGPARAMSALSDFNQSNDHLQIRWLWTSGQAGAPVRNQLNSADLERLRGGHEVSVMRDGSRMTFVPVVADGGASGAIEVAEPLTRVRAYSARTSRRVLMRSAAIAVLGLVLAVPLGYLLVGKRFSELAEKARRAGKGDLSSPLRLRGRDEISRLGEVLDDMCDDLASARDTAMAESKRRMAALEQLRHADRLRVVGTLASGVAHELGTPLNVVAGRAGMIEDGRLPQSEVTLSAKVIRTQSERMTKIIRQLLDFARRHQPKRVLTDLREISAETVRLIANLGQKRRVDLRLDDASSPVISDIDRVQIQQAMANLVINAIEATAPGGRVIVGARLQSATSAEDVDLPPGTYPVLFVEDCGRGIPGADAGHIFEPFFTTKEVGEGTGLGLSIAYGIVREHGGWIDVRSEPGRGSCFAIHLPAKAMA